MNPSDPRKAISKIIRERLANGEKKDEIYEHLQAEFNATDISSRFLAQWPYPEDRKNNKGLNTTLLIILVLIIAVRFYTGVQVFHKYSATVSILMLIPLIYVFIIYQVSRFNGSGYMLTTLLCGFGVFRIWRDFPKEPSAEYIAIACTLSVLYLAAVAVSEILRRRLLPNSTFLMRAKKNEDGSYKF